MCWVVSSRRGLRQSEELEYASLLSLLSNVFICSGEVDFYIWKPSPSSIFSTKSFSRGFKEEPNIKHFSSLVRVSLAPPRVEAFWLLAVSRKVYIVDFIRRRGILLESSSNLCQLCGLDREAIDRLFLHCDFS